MSNQRNLRFSYFMLIVRQRNFILSIRLNLEDLEIKLCFDPFKCLSIKKKSFFFLVTRQEKV